MNTDHMEEMEADAGSAGWAHQADLLAQEEAYLRHEAARAAVMFTKAGGHPDAAASLERALLTCAGLEIIPEGDERQPDLFNIAA